MEIDYESRQVRLDADHERAYNSFYQSLSEEEKATLRSACVSKGASLDHAYIEHRYNGGQNRPSEDDDLPKWEDTLLMSETVDMAKEIDTFPHQLLELGVPMEVANSVAILATRIIESRVAWEKARVTQSVIATFLKPGNLRIQAYAMCFAAGLEVLNGIPSQIECAKMLGVTRAALSKFVVKWRDSLGLRLNGFGKSLKSRQSYRKTALERNWRKQAFVASTTKNVRAGSESNYRPDDVSIDACSDDSFAS